MKPRGGQRQRAGADRQQGNVQFLKQKMEEEREFSDDTCRLESIAQRSLNNDNIICCNI